MITGIHAVQYTATAEADRAFFRDILAMRSVDAGGGWLIFALPPAELAFHPSEEARGCELYLVCDDLAATIADLMRKGVEFARPVREEAWGLVTSIRMPGGGELGLYQPKHPTALAVTPVPESPRA